MKAKKAALRLLVSAMLVVGLLPVAALAADGEQAGDVKVPAQAQVEKSAQDQAQASADDQAQATADDQAAAPAEKAEATEPATDQVNSAVVAAPEAADEPTTVANGTYETYKLYWYALVPDYALDSPAPEDEKWFGMGVGEISAVKAPKDYKVKDDRGISRQYYGTISASDYKPIDMPSVGSNVTPGLCPDITWKGKTYKYAQKGSENSLKQGYYTLEPARVVVAAGANAGANKYNPTTSKTTFHYDNVIVLNEENVYTVNYALKDVGESEWGVLSNYAQRVNSGYSESELKKPSNAEVPETKTVGGVTYQFDGWYKDEACTDKANFDGTITQNTTYYAHYIPQLGSLFVSKSVTGSAANVDQSFTFELSCEALAGKTFTAKAKDGVVNSVVFDDRGVAAVQLKHGESVTLTEVPAGSQVAVRETGLSGNARTTSRVSINNGTAETVATDGQTATKPMTVTIVSNQTQTLAFTNSAEAVSATGVSLDAGPMAGLFAVAAAGAGALAASGYKRRKREQGAWKE